MAQRRMFSKKITDTDLFLDMPLSAQALYFHLNMDADDEGFLGNTKTIRRKVGASEDDLKLLIAKRFIIPFETGVVVIKDWRIHNYIQKDRFAPTLYQEEKSQLSNDNNNSYVLMETKCIQNVSKMDTQDRLGKDRLGKDSEDILSGKPDPIPYQEIVEHLNSQAGTSYRHNTKKTRELIKARYKEGFDVQNFKKVIDNMITAWGNDPKMSVYLRPETLFGPKFEGYLNRVSNVTQFEFSGENTFKNEPVPEEEAKALLSRFSYGRKD